MTPANIGRLEARLDAHDDAIEQLRSQQREDRDDVRGLKNLIMGTLAAACGGLVLQLLSVLVKR
jgi:hypothetical protein